MIKRLEDKVAAFICKHGLLKHGTQVVVGLSGGPDSVCLALTLHKLGYVVVAAHCNFHLRGDESMRDERFVTELCLRMGWQLHRKDFDTESHAQGTGQSIEMAARELRYAWFGQLIEKTKAEAVAVGHHKDDNVETLILNLVRGTGLKGLCGMQPKQGHIVRPLLCVTHKEVLEWLDVCGEGYVTDRTNLEDEYARNKVRLDILPLLNTINAGAAENIVSTIENLTEVKKVYDAAISAAIAECCTETSNDSLHIDTHTLMLQPSPISVLHEVLGPKGFNKTQLKDILSAHDKCGRHFEAGSCRVVVDRGTLIVEEVRNRALPTLEVKTVKPEDLNMIKDGTVAYVDAAKVKSGLTVRWPRTGDSFAPFGMRGQRKLLSDFMTDCKMTLTEKEQQPLVVDGEEIVWVVGRRTSELYRVDDGSLTVFEVRVKS